MCRTPILNRMGVFICHDHDERLFYRIIILMEGVKV